MIFFFVKVFSEKEHADAFINGDLFARRLYCFKKMEDRDGRGDEYEGAIFHQREGLRIHLTATNQETGKSDTIEFGGEELASPLILQPRWYDHLNVFCMYAGHSGKFESVNPDNIDEFKAQLVMPEKCREFGNFAVVVKDPREFLERVKTAVTKHRFNTGQGW